MNLATNLFIAYLIFFSSTYIKLIFNKKTRNSHQDTRKKMESLRTIPLKSLEEQKAFLDLKYPRTPPFEWTFKNILKLIFKIGTMIIIFMGVKYLWKNYILFEFRLWQVLLIAVILPILLNKFFKKFNLQQDDLLIYFK